MKESLIENKKDFIVGAFNTLRVNGLVHTQKDFATLLNFSEGSISKALKGDERYMTDSLISTIQDCLNKMEMDAMFPSIANTKPEKRVASLPVIPVDAMAGTLGEFSAQIKDYDCERIVSPIAGADYAIKVFGESMTPEYPNGSLILIKKIQEDQFISWGNTFCLDTDNGAVIKNVFPTEDPEIIECRSINPAFPPFQIKTQYINGWYRVLMVMSQK